jgi:GT2 family glycosyltransferase
MVSNLSRVDPLVPVGLVKAIQPDTREPFTSTREPWIVVSVVTYRRAATLDRLLVEFARLVSPQAARVTILVIDNDKDGSARAVVDSHKTTLGDLRYVNEMRRGIPVARNRAIDEAVAWRADALCFIDDDEFPDPEWLHHLVACWCSTAAHLVGGPVWVESAPPGIGAWRCFLTQSLAGRAIRKYRATARAATKGGRFTVVTNNWLCDLRWFVQNGIRFDEHLLLSGGSDTMFHRQAKSAGCATAWCPQAIVYETMAPERLTLGYQFHRAASQSINHFRMKNSRISASVASIAMLNVVVRSVLGVLLLVFPIYGRASLVIAVRSLGWSYGRLTALHGARSKLYA